MLYLELRYTEEGCRFCRLGADHLSGVEMSFPSWVGVGLDP